jgi:hypothetical protein
MYVCMYMNMNVLMYICTYYINFVVFMYILCICISSVDVIVVYMNCLGKRMCMVCMYVHEYECVVVYMHAYYSYLFMYYVCFMYSYMLCGCNLMYFCFIHIYRRQGMFPSWQACHYGKLAIM